MSLGNLHDLDVIALPKQEQALAWLIQNGPLVADPPLPHWITAALAADGRIMRLRRGVYLAPTLDGRLPTLAQAVEALDHDGYITGHAALALHGLNDQEVGRWWVVSARRQADITYGPYRVHFLCSPTQAANGEKTRVGSGGTEVTVGTVVQAFVDELRHAPFGLDYVTTARVLRRAIQARRLTPNDISDRVGHAPSVAVARRAGFLLELIGAPVPEQLRAAGGRYRDVTDRARYQHVDRAWRLAVPRSRAELLRALR